MFISVQESCNYPLPDQFIIKAKKCQEITGHRRPKSLPGSWPSMVTDQVKDFLNPKTSESETFENIELNECVSLNVSLGKDYVHRISI